MLSKCANPACSERFRYLHQGKLFQLTPLPELEAATGIIVPQLYERFWLCDRCSKEMTVVWGGTEAEVIPLPPKPISLSPEVGDFTTEQKRKHAAAAGLHRR